MLDDAAGRAPGAAARWWLAQSLRALGADIATHGGSLILRKGRRPG
ncbi:deoxyribodipyrimidine photo-lyase [Bradyrhizobium sp. SSUT77]|nr:deoxyribodipyrimidine photo-lyase [Bradyrhizobium sp. SSUT77]MDH2341256.1 deoxyribodipyrimidine photo-lyase [Bradyrhizobium sp. SSUT77]